MYDIRLLLWVNAGVMIWGRRGTHRVRREENKDEAAARVVACVPMNRC